MAGDGKKDNFLQNIVGIGLSLAGQGGRPERKDTHQVRTLGTEPESTEWISQVIKVLWPSVQEYAPEAFKSYAEPLLLAQMPKMFPPVNFQK